MKYLRPKMAPVLLLAGLAVVGGVLGPDPTRALAQPAPGPERVLVVNPASHPARTMLVGPVTATISNTAAQAIPVAVQGTPNVAVPGGVMVANTEAEAIPVRDVGPAQSPQIPWVGSGQVILSDGEDADSEQFFVPPPGQRLVIESISVYGSLPAGQVANRANIQASTEANTALFNLPLPPLASPVPHLAYFGTFQQTKLPVSEWGVVARVQRNATTGIGVFYFTFSGYLVAEN